MLADAQACPDGGEYIWQWFLSLHASRGSGGFGPSPISNTDMASWAVLRNISLTWWEIRAIGDMDAAYMRVMAEQAKE